VADALALNAAVALAVATFGFSLALLAVSLLSYARLRSAKMLAAGGAFAVLAVAGGLSTWRAVVAREADLAAVGLDFLVLGFLYLSVALR